ncbi:LLM class flavin-dependent oxidoreductase [Rhizorhabdus phycosphaerae]|uniref:LLM class flavin-dependent oxidoreductase n=1 Tax=Rhizorhabdus phycosphaerae TaxID=2711156 RepID=UPI0013EA8809|nr:LLM class flavin-dependent oxidoreductase [Rhizorhabdus phycosphaerae]
MSRAFLLSVSTGDPRLNDPLWARSVLSAAEQAGIDLFVMGRPDARPFDAQVILGWAAAATSRIGIVAAVPAATSHPFHVARALSAVDFLSDGRSGWLPLSGDSPDGMAEDMVAAVRGLWDGWDPDTLIIDKASGRYLDASRVRSTNHEGPFFKVAGPVNAMRPPQGHILLVIDGADPVGAADADIALVSEGQVLPARRRLLKTSVDSDPGATAERFFRGEIDGAHFELNDAMADIALIAERFGPLVDAREGKTLRQRLGLALEEFA